MDRRSFLKSMGLGGLSLLAPKPLQVVAARLSDISDLPVHAGLARFRGVDDFSFQDVGIVYDDWQKATASIPQAVERVKDLMDNWTVHLAIRWGKDAYETIAVRPMARSVFCIGDRSHPYLPSSMRFHIKKADSVDVWAVPSGAPRFPLPRLTVAMFGPWTGTWTQPKPRDYASLSMHSVRLERGRAIELGLAAPSDPFEAV